MKVISQNHDQTVGVVSEADSLQHIGGFSLDLIVEWIKAINATYEVDKNSTIHLFVKKSVAQDSHLLFASLEGKDPMVCIAGKAPEDDEPWGDVRNV